MLLCLVAWMHHHHHHQCIVSCLFTSATQPKHIATWTRTTFTTYMFEHSVYSAAVRQQQLLAPSLPLRRLDLNLSAFCSAYPRSSNRTKSIAVFDSNFSQRFSRKRSRHVRSSIITKNVVADRCARPFRDANGERVAHRDYNGVTVVAKSTIYSCRMRTERARQIKRLIHVCV